MKSSQKVIQNSVAFLTILSFAGCMWQFGLHQMEKDFLESFFAHEQMSTNPLEKESLVTHVSLLNSEFQEKIINDGFERHGRYAPKSGVSLFGYSEILDFVLFRIYDCGHAVALFNQFAEIEGLHCQPVVIPGPQSHVISRCVKDVEVLFVDPLFNHLYIDAGGTPIPESELPFRWAESVLSASLTGILSYPINEIQYRNPKLLLNKMVDWTEDLTGRNLRTFSFRSLFTSQHEFFFKSFAVLMIALLLMYRTIR